MVFFVLIAIVVILLLWVAAAYNGFVKLSNLVKEGWSGIDVQLKRRYDLIPNLVETVKGYASHEKGVFEEVTKARAGMASAQTIAEKAEASNALSGTLKTLFAVAEAYPELKANQNFMSLQKDLAGIEEQLQLARRYYNGTVREYNTKIATFPNVLFSGMFGFKKEEFFEIEDAAQRNAPEVKF